MNRKFLFISMLIAVLLLAACSNGNDGSTNEASSDGVSTGDGISETIKIGMSAPITGPISDYGEGATRAAQIAIDQWNEKGGINGQKIEFITLDDEGSPDRATSNIQQLIQKDKIHAGYIPIGSGAAMAALPHAASSGLPFMNILSQTIEITYPNGVDEEPYENIFTFAMQNDMEAIAMGNYVSELGYKKVALMAESTPYGQTGLDLVTEVLKEEGIEIAGREQYDPQSTSMSAQLAKLNEQDPDSMLIIGLAPDVATITKDMNRLGMDVPMVTSAAVTAPQYKKLAGDLVEGVKSVIVSTYAEQELSSEAQEFVDLYVEKYGTDNWFNEDGTPSPFFVIVSNSYDATKFILSSIEEANSLDKQEILSVMNNTEFSSTSVGSTVNLTRDIHHVILSEHFGIGEYKRIDEDIKIELLD